MTATQIVDKMLEAGPLDAGEFLSDFPSRRAGPDDLHQVIQKLLRLKEQNGGQWSDTGDINVSIFGGDPIENFRPEHATYEHFQKIIDFDAAVVDFNGEIIGQGIAQENPLDTFSGWQAYLDLTNEGPMKFAVTFGKNDVESGSFEPGLEPEVEEVCRAHFNKFKEQFIDQVLWLEEGRRMTRQQWQKQLQTAEPDVQAADQFYREFSSGKEEGKLLSTAGAIAAYTWDWPEFDHWISYNNRSNDDKDGWKFYQFPQDSWKDYIDGVVYFRSKRGLYIKGIPGSFGWTVEWSRGSGTSWDCRLSVTFEHWDKERIWKSHWKQPKMWDYVKREENAPAKRPATAQDWDDINPDYLDSKDFDQSIKDKLLKTAKPFVERLAQVAKIDRIRWNLPELFVAESLDIDPEEFSREPLRPDMRFVEVLKLFTDTFKRHGGDTGPEIDEACWRVVLTQIGASDHAIHDRARSITDAGYEVLRGDIEPGTAWRYAYTFLNDQVAQKPLVDDVTLIAIKRLFLYRYTEEDSFIERAMQEGLNEAVDHGPSPKGYVQIGGDFGNPWEYGGTWVREQDGDMVHFPGMDSEDKEIETGDSRIDGRLTPQDYAVIVDKLHLDAVDAWENAEDEVRQRHADALNAARRFQFYHTSSETDEWIEKDWAEQIVEIKEESQMTDEQWAALTAPMKTAAVADRIGWHEFDHYPGKTTKAELSELLGIDL